MIGLRRALIVIALLSILPSCTQADLLFWEKPSHGLVRIYPEGTRLPEGTLSSLRYHFYQTEGPATDLHLESDDYGNYESLHEANNYVVLGTIDVPGVTYTDLEDFRTATAHITDLMSPATRSPLTPDQSLATLYCIRLKDVEVLPGDTVHHTPQPDQLTRTLAMTFTLDGDLARQVQSIDGFLFGIYPSVNIYTGRTTDQEAARAPQLSTAYTAYPPEPGEEEGHWSTSIRLLGLLDPMEGTVYHNLLKVGLLLDNGEMLYVDVDITSPLSEALAQHDGILPLDVTVKLDILLEVVFTGIGGRVVAWEYITDEEGIKIGF